MKKLLLFFAALLPCCLAYSQEADDSDKTVDIQIIPRFDFNPYFTPGKSGDGSSGISFGNSSIYSLVEADLSDHLSFTLSNHWLSMDPAALYQGTLYSNTNNWLDVATFAFNFGNWTFTLGKDCLATGGFEYDDWDVDVDYLLAGETPLYTSYLWYNLPCYEWGGKISYSIEDHTTLAFQMVTSPFGERPFASGLYSYSAKWDGEYGPFSNRWSVSAMQRPDGGFEWLVALAQRVELGDFTAGLDWYNVADVDYGNEGDSPCEFIKGNTIRPTLAYEPSEKFSLALAGNIYTRLGELYDLNIGTFAHYYPIETIQLHAGLGWDLNTGMVSALAGIKVNLHLFQR